MEVNLPLLLPKHICQQSLLWTNSSEGVNLHVKTEKRTCKMSDFQGGKLDWKEVTTPQAEQT